MPYPKRLLNDYETVAVDLHPHWWYFAKAVFAMVGSIVVGIVVLLYTDGGTTARRVLGWASIALIVACAMWLAVRYFRWGATNFVITSDRLIFREGVLAKNGIEIPLERVNNVMFNQSILERMIGAGDLLIESGGEEGRQEFTDIRNPDRVKNQIHAQMEENENRKFVGRGSVGGTDVASQLEKLEGMMGRGTLTPDEFERQKRRLLGSD